jgi:hypothetical protein
MKAAEDSPMTRTTMTMTQGQKATEDTQVMKAAEDSPMMRIQMIMLQKRMRQWRNGMPAKSNWQTKP